MQQKLVV